MSLDDNLFSERQKKKKKPRIRSFHKLTAIDGEKGLNGAKTDPDELVKSIPVISSEKESIGAKKDSVIPLRDSDKFDYLMISPLQRRLLKFLFHTVRHDRDRITPPIYNRSVAETMGSTHAAVKKAFQILENKEALKRRRFKRGTAGWTIYQIPPHVYQTIEEHLRDF